MNTDEQQFKDEQELAKVLAGINDQLDKNSGALNKDFGHVNSAPKASLTTPPAQKVQHNPMQNPAQLSQNPTQAQATKTPAANTVANVPAPVPNASAMTQTTPMTNMTTPTQDSNHLNSVLHDALNDLRPLVDKLNVPVEEKFNTYLLLIRSTDDNSLVEPAYQAAKQIKDDTKRAMALLDVIKEINYFTASKSTER